MLSLNINYLQYTPTSSTPSNLNQMCALSLNIYYLQYTPTSSTPSKLNQICALSLNIYYLQYTPTSSTPSNLNQKWLNDVTGSPLDAMRYQFVKVC